jgi:maltooligosyltrehalose synthase
MPPHAAVPERTCEARELLSALRNKDQRNHMPFTDPGGVPASTYRLQLRKEFPFADAQRVVPYLHALGISHCYLSPILMSAPGSTHGYDVADYHRIDTELGGSRGFEELAAAVRAHGMGVVLDFVPNHMGIEGSSNVLQMNTVGVLQLLNFRRNIFLSNYE